MTIDPLFTTGWKGVYANDSGRWTFKSRDTSDFWAKPDYLSASKSHIYAGGFEEYCCQLDIDGPWLHSQKRNWIYPFLSG